MKVRGLGRAPENRGHVSRHVSKSLSLLIAASVMRLLRGNGFLTENAFDSPLK
jgi:hypothetical protein